MPRIQSTRQQVAIPHPTNDLASISMTVLALKEAVEQLSAQRGHSDNHAVTWADLKRLGLVKPGQEPEAISGRSDRTEGP